MRDKLHFPICTISAAILLGSNAQGGEIRLNDCVLRLNGNLVSANVNVGPSATLCGSGYIRGGVSVAGVLKPGPIDNSDVGTLIVDGAVSFDSQGLLDCFASSHSALDRLVSSGPVKGACEVRLHRAENATPLNEIIVEGAGDSDYRYFVLEESYRQDWELTTGQRGELLASEKAADKDRDAMPDWWERIFFPDEIACRAHADDDDDGMTNWGEYEAGTDPTDETSVLYITSIVPLGPDGIEICWLSASNRIYTVHGAASLTGQDSPIVATDISGEPPINTYTIESSSDQAHFYWLEVRRK